MAGIGNRKASIGSLLRQAQEMVKGEVLRLVKEAFEGLAEGLRDEVVGRGRYERGGSGGATGHGGWRHWSVSSIWSVPSVRSIWSVPSGRGAGSSGLRGPTTKGFGLRGTCLRATHRQVLAPSLGRPQLRFGREGFPQVQILENRSASALPAPSRARQAGKPLRETPPPFDHVRGFRKKASPRWIPAETGMKCNGILWLFTGPSRNLRKYLTRGSGYD